MRAALILLLALAGCVVVPLGTLGPAPDPGGYAIAPDPAGRLINARRALERRAPLVRDARLAEVAGARAAAMAAEGRLAHRGADGSTPWSRIAAGGYAACRTAENIARGQQSVEAVVEGWMASPGHRANLMDPRLTAYGFGQSGAVWVLVMARPC